MARKATNMGNIVVARKFFEKFGMQAIAIDDFDMFIIDNKMAKDPGTSDTTSLSWGGFVQERGQAKNRLNEGGRYLDQPFFIVITTPGVTYTIAPWNESTRAKAAGLGDSVHNFAQNRVNDVIKSGGHVAELIQLALEDEDISDLEETALMIDFIAVQSGTFEKQVKALTEQFNQGVAVVEDRVKRITQKREQKKLSVG